jgi:hypothetical protein
MKFDHGSILAGKPRGETPAPPHGKRSPVLPRLPACILFTLRATLASGRRQHPAFGEHGSAHLAAKPRRYGRRLAIPAASPKSRPRKNVYWAALTARRALSGLRGPDRAASPRQAITHSCPRVPELLFMLQRATYAAASLMLPRCASVKVIQKSRGGQPAPGCRTRTLGFFRRLRRRDGHEQFRQPLRLVRADGR